MSARAKWREHVRAWRASGETAAVFCDRAGLNPRTLSWWAWKLGNETTPAVAESRLPTRATFIELAPLELAVGNFELEVGSVIVRVPIDFDAAALGRLLDVLEARR